MATWREIREEIITTSSSSIRSILRGPVTRPYFYKKINSPFSSFENVLPEELEQICDSEMHLLLSGFQTDNIRVEIEELNDNFVGLISNPSFDPFMRSAIDRFTDVVRDLYTIRVHGYHISKNLMRSRISRLVVGHLSRKVDVLLEPTMTEGWTERDEGFNDSDFGLNRLTRSIAVVRPSIRCYAEVIRAIHEKNLSGGEVINLLEEKLERAVSDRAELQVVLRIAWKAFFEMAGSWISRGVIEDPCMEFFIWPREKIKAVNQSHLDAALQAFPHCADVIKNDPFLLVPSLCPFRVQPIMADMYRCGRSVQQSNQVDSFEWAKLDGAARFVQKVLSLSAETSQTALNKLKADGHLSDFISCFHMTLLNSPWLSEVAAVLCAKGLVNRKYNEVAEGTLQAVTHLTLMRHMGQLPFLKNFKFVRGKKDLFDALLACSLVTNGGDSSVSRKSNVDVAMLPERLSLDVEIPQQMAGLFSHDTVNKYCLIFRLQLRVHLAGIILEECRSSLPRSGVQDKDARHVFLLLNNLNVYLLRFRMKLCYAIQEALRTFNDKFAKASKVEDVSSLQMNCINEVFKEAPLSNKHVCNIEDLLLLIDAFATKTDLVTVQEHYNMWLDQVESSRFLGSQDIAFN